MQTTDVPAALAFSLDQEGVPTYYLYYEGVGYKKASMVEIKRLASKILKDAYEYVCKLEKVGSQKK